DANGKLVGLRWLIRDISAAKQAEATLVAQARQLAVNSELEQYVSVLAHDLQEPVRVLATYAMLLSEKLKDKLDEESSLYLQFAEQSAAKVLTQIEDLLSYSSLASRDEELELVDTGEVLAEVLSALSPKIKESGAKIIQSEMPTVNANREQLRRVFDNLIANAIKFSSSGKPHVRISSFKSGNEWVFCVRDKGIGIDMQYAEKIFGMFQRLHSQSEYQGNGIGLAICKRIIDYHHGRIWIESEPGAGTAIFFSLPIAVVKVASANLAD
ncbi:MAG: GHKL domain-containing protein, partial [Candidatus Obscuribacterales bacterium]|nr:GHKL domain-containing protein [Candidatus Obscuribacterales bacterium]